jgi:alkanesulfonate monooxygenase SsuD/methylene tetrahydromethanopterin reductase-like flavin-dependent oxidoreductase (luciferase family)
MTKLQFGVRINGESYEGALREAQAAEALGYDFIVLSDQPSSPNLEGWTLATAIAAQTSRVRLLHATLNLPWRYAPMLAKMGTALDQVSNGRFIFCLGGGSRLPFLVEEYTAYGLDVGTPAQRYERIRDFITLMRGLETGEPFSMKTAEFEVIDAIALPKPAGGHIPIWVGSWGPRLNRLIGRVADGWMRSRSWPDDLDEYAAMNAIINSSASAAKRDPEAIVRELNAGVVIAATEAELRDLGEGNGWMQGGYQGLAGTPEQVADRLRAAITAGANAFGLSFESPDAVELFARQVIPALER